MVASRIPTAQLLNMSSESVLRTVTDLLRECSLEHLEPTLAGTSLAALDAKYDEGRPVLLEHLKTAGCEKLGERQKVANALGKAKRGERVQPADANGAPATPTPVIDVSEASAAPAESVTAPAAAPAVPTGTFRWLVDISTWEPSNPEWQRLLSSLPPADAEKVMKFKFVADQKRALVSRLLQRRACFEATGVRWKDVDIQRTKGGKPFMANKPNVAAAASRGLAANWNFNVSAPLARVGPPSTGDKAYGRISARARARARRRQAAGTARVRAHR